MATNRRASESSSSSSCDSFADDHVRRESCRRWFARDHICGMCGTRGHLTHMCSNFKRQVSVEPEEKEPIGICGIAIENEHNGELFKDDSNDSSEDDLLLKLSKVSKEKLIDGLFSYELKLHAL